MTQQDDITQRVLTDENVKLDINGATWFGMRVAGWTWEEAAFSPDQFPSENTVRHYASHWSTGPHNAERLYRESDVAALLSKLRAPVADAIQWPTMPESKGQSPILFEDGYAEGWAKCMDECRRAVSQASAEDVRNAALYLLREAREMLPAFATAEAIGAWSEKVRKFGASEVIDVPPQADKDGGQQRAGDVPSDDALAQIGYAAAIAEVGWGEAWVDLESDGDTQQEWRAGAKAIRAALSAHQADGIRRPLPYIDPSQEPPK